MKLGDTFAVPTAASMVLEQRHTRDLRLKQKFPGKVVWIHPAGRFAVLDFGGYRESFFPEELAGRL